MLSEEGRSAGSRRARGKFEPIGGLVRKVLRDLGLERRMRESRAIEVWAEVVGETIAGHAQATSIREGVLFVDVASNVWMQELGLLREKIVSELNDRLGEPVVRRIVLSIERTPRSAGDDPKVPRGRE